MSIGKDTFDFTKKDYNAKLGRIITNHRANSKLIGEPAEFILRSCRLTEQWLKLASDPDVVVYLRNVNIAGARTVKMLSLERGSTKQPVSKSKLVDALYPVKKTAATATPEEKHYNAVKGAMRNAVHHQLKAFRDEVRLPCVCTLTGKYIRNGMKTDVDHVTMSFSELADKFIALKGLTYADITLQGPPTNKVFRDKQLWGEWTRYHLGFAQFALVCASANRSKGSDGYETPVELYGSFKSEDPDCLNLDF